jgi:Protein of unknown function (DUF3309)
MTIAGAGPTFLGSRRFLFRFSKSELYCTDFAARPWNPDMQGARNLSPWEFKEKSMLGTILIVVLVLALVGALPRWSHSREWGYAPTGGLGLVLFIVVILLILGRI